MPSRCVWVSLIGCLNDMDMRSIQVCIHHPLSCGVSNDTVSKVNSRPQGDVGIVADSCTSQINERWKINSYLYEPFPLWKVLSEAVVHE